MNLSELSDLTLLLIFFSCGTVGVIAHYAKKAIRKQTSSSFFEYMLNNIWHTFGAFGATFGSLIGSLAAGIDLTQISSMAGAVMAGFIFDSGINKDK